VICLDIFFLWWDEKWYAGLDGIVAMPESMDNTNAEESPRTIGTFRSWLSVCLFWLSVWCGTTVAGGAFGFLVGIRVNLLRDCVFSSLICVVAGAIFGAFTIANVAILSWCLWLSRFRVVMGGLAGGVTWITATLSAFRGSSWELALAGLLGTFGGGLAGLWYHSRSRAKGHQVTLQHRWRFTLRDLHIRVIVFSALLAIDVFIVNFFLASGIVR